MIKTTAPHSTVYLLISEKQKKCCGLWWPELRLDCQGLWGEKLAKNSWQFDLHNVIKDPTRTTVTTSTLLDLLITIDTTKIITSGTFDRGLSDHCLVYCIIKLQRKRTPPKYISAKNYKEVNIEKLKHALTTAPWSVIEAFDDPDDITWAWETYHGWILIFAKPWTNAITYPSEQRRPGLKNCYQAYQRSRC